MHTIFFCNHDGNVQYKEHHYMLLHLPTTTPCTDAGSMIKKNYKHIKHNVYWSKRLQILHKKQQTQLEKDRKIKHKRIHGISFVTRLGKDSLYSSFPSLETQKCQKYCYYNFETPDSKKIADFLYPTTQENT